MTDTYQDASEANFALYNCKVVNALKSMHDYFRYYPTMIHWVGFKLTKLEIEHAEREDGIKSSGNLKKRMNLAMTTIIYFSDKPLRLIVRMGILISVISALFAVALVVKYFMVDQDVSGWTSIFISIWFVLGFMITILGMVGIYVGKIFELVKLRSTYIVGERLNYEPMTEAE